MNEVEIRIFYYFKIWLVKLWVWICILTVTIGTRNKIQGQFIIFSLFPHFFLFELNGVLESILRKMTHWLNRTVRVSKGNMKGVKTKPLTKTKEHVLKQTLLLLSLFIVNPENCKRILSQKYKVVSKNHSFWQNNLLYVEDPLSKKWFHYSDYGILKHGFKVF